MSDSKAEKIIRITSIIFAALLLAGAALYLFVFVNFFKNDAVYGGGEDIVLYCSRLLAGGYQIYHSSPSIDAPFCYPMYPPVHYYFLVFTHKLFGDSLIVGRLVCFSFVFFTAAMIGMIANIRSGNRLAGLASAGIFLFFHPILVWSGQNRVDITALMFAVAGALWYFKFEKSRFAYLFSSVFFALAVYSKQTMLACFAALVLSLLFLHAKRAV
ncbi:MAG TPA: glycosyltransferase family 39 protein, partial [bacterium]|nr:glycosyltransferase family 39 protein [bacterium]